MQELNPIRTIALGSEVFEKKGIKISVVRLDEIHPVISGNKLFKLKYFLDDIIKKGNRQVVTFGGAYSNHLVATACACKLNNLPVTGIVRGDRPSVLSHTLQDCIHFGMELQFISRQEYSEKDDAAFLKKIATAYKDSYVIPEGGYHPLGAMGAAGIMSHVDAGATHIACAVGTGTTVAGLLTGCTTNQQVIAVPVLKGMTDLPERLKFLTGKYFSPSQLYIADGYHFGGYAKSNQQLFDCMNQLYDEHRLATDFVYTGKMMFGLLDMIEHDFFKRGSHIVCLHTGGMQGNLSLQKSILTFT